MDVLAVGEVNAEFLVGLSGQHAQNVLVGREGGVEGHWPRVWALRAFMYTWDPRAAPYVVDAIFDESWRVREMALKISRIRHVKGALPAAKKMLDDPVARVREAAAKVIGHDQSDRWTSDVVD